MPAAEDALCSGSPGAASLKLPGGDLGHEHGHDDRVECAASENASDNMAQRPRVGRVQSAYPVLGTRA